MTTDMTGRTCVVTGASSGIGAATAAGLAARGATLALVGRDPERLEAVAQRCRDAGAAKAITYRADFAELAQVRRLADELLADHDRIDVLVNNAAQVVQRRSETVDGYETMFAVNHLAPYLLTRLLLDRLVASAPARVVTVSSDAYKFGDVDPDDWMSTGSFAPMKVYGRTKLAGLLFTAELARRLAGTGVTANAVHPGFVASSIARDNRAATLMLRVIRPFIRSPEKGARSSIVVASEPVGGEVTGKYFVNGKVRATKPHATDAANAARLWSDSARLVGLPTDR